MRSNQGKMRGVSLQGKGASRPSVPVRQKKKGKMCNESPIRGGEASAPGGGRKIKFRGTISLSGEKRRKKTTTYYYYKEKSARNNALLVRKRERKKI